MRRHPPASVEPALSVRAQAAVGDDAVDMDVLSRILPPGMQHRCDAELSAKPAGIAAELKDSPGGRLEEQPVNERRVLERTPGPARKVMRGALAPRLRRSARESPNVKEKST